MVALISFSNSGSAACTFSGVASALPGGGAVVVGAVEVDGAALDGGADDAVELVFFGAGAPLAPVQAAAATTSAATDAARTPRMAPSLVAPPDESARQSRRWPPRAPEAPDCGPWGQPRSTPIWKPSSIAWRRSSPASTTARGGRLRRRPGGRWPT